MTHGPSVIITSLSHKYRADAEAIVASALWLFNGDTVGNEKRRLQKDPARVLITVIDWALPEQRQRGEQRWRLFQHSRTSINNDSHFLNGSELLRESSRSRDEADGELVVMWLLLAWSRRFASAGRDAGRKHRFALCLYDTCYGEDLQLRMLIWGETRIAFTEAAITPFTWRMALEVWFANLKPSQPIPAVYFLVGAGFRRDTAVCLKDPLKVQNVAGVLRQLYEDKLHCGRMNE